NWSLNLARFALILAYLRKVLYGINLVIASVGDLNLQPRIVATSLLHHHRLGIHASYLQRLRRQLRSLETPA
ncbi:hypothetical protein QL093DRAFT_1480325, partial [Fusarium oxysporum]